MKFHRKNCTMAQMMMLTRQNLERVRQEFYKENGRLPEPDEMAYFCPKCGWWTDSTKHLHAVEIEFQRKDGNGVPIIGDVSYKAVIICPECETFLTSCPVKKFLREVGHLAEMRRAGRSSRVSVLGSNASAAPTKSKIVLTDA